MTAWTGTEIPGGPDLLEIARQTLLDTVLPKLDGDARFKALMIANAMAIALRETRLGQDEIAQAMQALAQAAGPDTWAVCHDIRTGRHDPGTAAHQKIGAALLALAQARCRISAPKALEGDRK
ncbi:DUF6285 domain-containing protein [Limobrevibacterium gyesilva]|uniref:DUF6285 domain-containing protein n=1 Tax=Limobrevibacterium gyesilva TaxID=2991712 RepID=A0AA41YJ25_9PROT|nr:DUF6285 domain-containing protein [Limobrevibacterium gyesilva]MCW3474546.1 DUF6285 domain-containing protein [Limobrevibacterium gyesilva]